MKIEDDIPLDVVALVGCGVPTGFGSAVKAGEVQPGDTTIVYGVGGVGINAVQGASHRRGAVRHRGRPGGVQADLGAQVRRDARRGHRRGGAGAGAAS